MRSLPAPPLDERVRELRKIIGDDTDAEQTIREYAVLNWECELRRYLDMQIVGECRGRGNPHVLELHHIAGRGKYAETVGNWISVSQPVHSWLTDHSKPGFVLCAYAKWRKDESDWAAWTACKPKYRLSALGTDEWVAACERWPVVDGYRRELLENANG